MSTHVLKVAPEDEHLRLDVYLTKHLSQCPSRMFIKKLIEEGHVKIKTKIVKPHYKVTTGETIDVEIPKHLKENPELEAQAIPLDIFYEDDAILIINKPSGLMVHPATGQYTGTLVNALLHHADNLSDMNEDMRPGIVHRLDRDTSGLMIVAKDNMAHARLAKQFERHEIKKQYVALVEGEVAFDEGEIDEPIGRHVRHRDKKTVSYDEGAKDSVTRYKVIKRYKGVTLIRLFPRTGRTHQLRVHMAHLKHPILGDEKYGHKNSFPRLALHAQSIGFKHPTTKEWIEFSAPAPKDFYEKVRE